MTGLRSLLTENDFLQGGLLLGALGTGLVLARQYLLKGAVLIWRWCTVEIEVRSVDVSFSWLLSWLDAQPYTKRARRLSVSVLDGDGQPTVEGQPKEDDRGIIFSPSVGSHFFLYRGRLLWLRRSRQEPSRDNYRERETFQITMLGRSQHILRSLLVDARTAHLARERQGARIFVSVTTYWNQYGYVRPRSLDSVVLPEGQKQELLADMRRFLTSEEWYHDMGIPYRRGYLLHGVPGSGKTSLVAALAHEAKLDLYVVQLPGLNDHMLRELLQNVNARRAILLFEDIDSAQAARDRAPAQPITAEKDPFEIMGGVTVSGLLNVLDGVASRDGYVTVLTTNYRDRLDPALVRPGRVDLELAFAHATGGQARCLYRRFYGDVGRGYEETLVRGLAQHGSVSMAQLQEHFLRHRYDPAGAALVNGNLPGVLESAVRTE